jgi:acyl-CoA synthetase (AMP-forming)/AMP-acid ligase II
LAVAERLKTVAEEALGFAERTPDTICAVDDGRAWSYAEMTAEAQALAAGLAGLGLRAGDVISFELPNWREALCIDLASALLGCVVNPIVPIYRGAELEFILANSGAKAVFLPEEFRGFRYADALQEFRARLPALAHVVRVRSDERSGAGASRYEDVVAAGRGRSVAPVRSEPGDLKMLMYTSGTTGRAKGVRHSHATLGYAVRHSAEAWFITPGTPVMAASPITHVASFMHGVEMPFILGSRSVLLPRWDAAQAVKLIDQHGIRFFGGATPFLQELISAAQQAGSKLASLRVFSCGGAAVPPDLIRRACAAFPSLRASRSYGMTEAPWITRGFHGEGESELAADTDGRISGYDVRIADDAGRALPEGAEGEITVRGEALFLGYLDATDTANAFDGLGYFHTGDLGVRRGESLTVTGRKKDLIIRGGENLSPKEIEDVLHTHPLVREAAVVSMPHARLGEGVCAYVIAREGASLALQQLADHCAAAGLARQKAPERLELVEDLPRTASGKVRKDVLRREIAAKIEGTS